MAEGQSPSIVPMDDDPLYEVISHLGAVLMQAERNDDPIIIEHVRSAHGIAVRLYRKSQREQAHA